MVAHSMGRNELAKRTGAAIQQAEKYFTKAVNEDPGYATAYASLAESYTLLVEYADKPRKEFNAKAQQAVDKALKLDPELGLAWAAQGLIYMGTENKHKEAMKALEKAIELNPSYAMAYMWYGSLQDDVTKKMEYHQKALQLDPKSPVAGYNVATNLMKMGRDNEAMDVFSQIVEADPFYPGAYNLVAEINQFSGRIDQAIIQFKKSYELGGDRYIAVKISQLYIDLGDMNNAHHWMKLAKNNASEAFQGQLRWLDVTALLAEGKRDEAREKLLQFKSTDNPTAQDYYNAVVANYWLQDFPETIEQYELAEELNAKNDKSSMNFKHMDVYIYTAFAYQQLEQLDKARTLMQQIIAEQDRVTTSGGRVTAELWYQKSLLQAIEGEHQMSLITLQRAIDEGWSQPLKTMEEPILQSLKSDENFKAMMAGLETRMTLMREQLAFEESFSSHWRG